MNAVKLGNGDRKRVLAFIADEPEANLFIEGDILNHGLDGDTVELFAFGADWECLVLRYFGNYVLYSKSGRYDTEAVSSFLRERDPSAISGTKRSVLPILPAFPEAEHHETYLCRCNKTGFRSADAKQPVTKLGADDSAALVDLYCRIDEFSDGFVKNREKKISEMRKTLGTFDTGFGIFAGESLAAGAYYTAKTESGAMIIGVATDPRFRKRGYATRIVGALCDDAFANGLTFLSLFYDNPAAGAIYRRIGFEEIGKWSMLKF